MESNTVTLSLERYDELKECEVLYEKLILSFAILLDNAELSYNDKYLRFNDDDVIDLVKTYDIDKYLRTIKILKEKRDE